MEDWTALPGSGICHKLFGSGQITDTLRSNFLKSFKWVRSNDHDLKPYTRMAVFGQKAFVEVMKVAEWTGAI
jgi:hypothetical protein